MPSLLRGQLSQLLPEACPPYCRKVQAFENLLFETNSPSFHGSWEILTAVLHNKVMFPNTNKFSVFNFYWLSFFPLNVTISLGKIKNSLSSFTFKFRLPVVSALIPAWDLVIECMCSIRRYLPILLWNTTGAFVSLKNKTLDSTPFLGTYHRNF